MGSGNEFEFRSHVIGIERLHHEIVGARVHRASYLRNIIFIQANDDFRTIATLHSAELPKEFVTIKRRHVDVDENSVRHGNRASRQRLPCIWSFGNPNVRAFKNTANDFPDYCGVIHYQDMPHSCTLCLLGA